MAGERTEDHVVAIGELDEELLDKQPPANGHGARGGGACADGRSTVRRRQRHGGRWSDTRNQPQVAEPLEAPGGMRGASARLPFRGKPLMPCRVLCCAATQGDEHPLGVNGSSAPVAQPAQRGGLRAATSNAYRMTKEATIAGSFSEAVQALDVFGDGKHLFSRARMLREAFANVPQERLLVLPRAALRADPLGTARVLSEFLGLERFDAARVPTGKVNAYVIE